MRGVPHLPPVRTFGSVTASRIIAKELVPETCRPNILPRCSRVCSCPPPVPSCGVSGLLGLDSRPRFGIAVTHPIEDDLGRFGTRFLDQFSDVPGILDGRLE